MADLRDDAAYGRLVIETCWLQPARGDWLHTADEVSDTVAAAIGDGEFAAVRATCGRVIDAGLPGPASRLGAPRCPTCCRRSGLPDGKGSPLNDPACRAVLGLDEPEPGPTSDQSSAGVEAVRSAPAASNGEG